MKYLEAILGFLTTIARLIFRAKGKHKPVNLWLTILAILAVCHQNTEVALAAVGAILSISGNLPCTRKNNGYGTNSLCNGRVFAEIAGIILFL